MKRMLGRLIEMATFAYLGAWLWSRRPTTDHVLVTYRADEDTGTQRHAVVITIKTGWNFGRARYSTGCGKRHIWVVARDEADAARQLVKLGTITTFEHADEAA